MEWQTKEWLEDQLSEIKEDLQQIKEKLNIKTDDDFDFDLDDKKTDKNQLDDEL